MIAYYDITKNIHDTLISNPDINSVEIGDISKVDFNKQEMFPFAHILIGSAQFINGIIRFSVTVSCMDVVDITKKDIRNELETFKGIDNKQDILNTMLAVIEDLDKSLRKGGLSDLDYFIDSDTSAEPFEDRFQNLVTGWSATFVIDVPNRQQRC